MCGGGGDQKITQKTELDPVLQAHLYGGKLPASAMTGIVPVYFRPGGSLASQASNVQDAYYAMNNSEDGDSTPTTSGNSQPEYSGEYKDGGEVQHFQNGTQVLANPSMDVLYTPTFATEGNEPLSLAEQVYQLTVGTDLGGVLPQYQVAGRTDIQRLAAEMARSGIGQYGDALSAGREASGKGIEALQSAISQGRDAASAARGDVAASRADVQKAISDLAAGSRAAEGVLQEAMPYRDAAINILTEAGVLGAGATKSYDPTTGYQKFMDPYLEDVVRQVEQDISRQGMMQEDVLRGQAAQAGAFGGSRAAVAQRELGRNVADQQARMATQLRSDAFRQAQSQAQQAFESQQARQAQIAGLYGQLGQATGSIGSQYGQLGLQSTGQQIQAAGQAGQLGLGQGQLGLGLGQLGVQAAGQAAQAAQGIGQLGFQQAQIGQMGAQMRQQDINTMLMIGAQEQAQQQAALDAARMNQYQRVMAPYQQTAFRADILSGAPTGIASTMIQPGPSPVSQLAGLGMAAYGIRGAMGY